MGGSRSRPSRPVELEESPTSRSFTRQVPFNDEEPASPSSPPWTPLGPVSPGTGSLSLGGRQFFGRSSGPSSPEPSPLSPKSQSSKSSRPFLARFPESSAFSKFPHHCPSASRDASNAADDSRSWSALSLGGKKDEPQELTEFLRPADGGGFGAWGVGSIGVEKWWVDEGSAQYWAVEVEVKYGRNLAVEARYGYVQPRMFIQSLHFATH
ncbi:unnamed protein product [Durusdinium trenchii]|uniref:Uncharacterized protein n=1 Tax=Durusdinium trenchii TaxID=1381693 RepID=A0ABP0JAE0_9DINO